MTRVIVSKRSLPAGRQGSEMDWVVEDLQTLEKQGLRRRLRQVQGRQSRTIFVDGKEVLNFCSNNYLGLADDARLVKAAAEAMGKYGFGSGASRLVCGNMTPHEELERALAELKHTESGLVFNSGYSANTGIIPALFGRNDSIFSDRLNHASIVDGIILSRAGYKRYPHLDLQALEEGLKQSSASQRRLIVTDTVFSMDGDTAPLKEIVELARRYEAWVMVDEAHGFGVLGHNGAGLAEELGVSDQIDIQMGTLSKAAGCFGAYACGRGELRDYLLNHARSFIYTTAIPPAWAAAAQQALNIIQDPVEGPQRRQALKTNADYLRSQLKTLGFDTMNSTTPIIPIIVKEAQTAVDMSRRLFEQGIFVQAIRPPTVPLNTARLRVTVMSTHTQDDLDHFLACMKGL